MIEVKGRTLVIPAEERLLGFRADTGAEKRAFSVPRYYGDTDLALKQAELRYTLPSGAGGAGRIVQEVDNDRILLTWTVDEAVTAETGRVYVHLRFTGADYLLQTADGCFTVRAVHAAE